MTFIRNFLYLVKTGLDCSTLIPFDGVTVSRAAVVSPNYKNGYINDLFCGLTINVAEGKLVLINFEKFEVGDILVQDRRCDQLNDYLAIRDGSTIHSKLIGPKLCGHSLLPPILSSNNSVTLEFFTNHDTTYEGFILTAIEVGKRPRK